MEQIKASRRTAFGTHQSRHLRAEGRVPGVIYGHGLATESIAVSGHDLDLAIHHGERLLEIDLEGKAENVLIKEVQYDTFGKDILHVDLTRVSLDERVKVTVPIILRGTPAGAGDGGVLQQIAMEVSVECLVRAIPEEIRVSVIDMKVEDVLHMRDLPLPDGATLIGEPDAIVCNVTVVAEVAETIAEEEVSGEPEVIGAKPAPEDEEADQAGKSAKPDKKEKE